jgi:hypothetical protein
VKNETGMKKSGADRGGNRKQTLSIGPNELQRSMQN